MDTTDTKEIVKMRVMGVATRFVTTSDHKPGVEMRLVTEGEGGEYVDIGTPLVYARAKCNVKVGHVYTWEVSEDFQYYFPRRWPT